jgi:flagellar basal body-associated protein FliL
MKFSRIYADVQDKFNSVIYAKRIAEEEQRRKTTLIIVLISVAVAVAAVATAATLYCVSKNEEGERRGKVLVAKIKSKLPKKAEACECDEAIEEALEEAVEVVVEEAPAEE